VKRARGRRGASAQLGWVVWLHGPKGKCGPKKNRRKREKKMSLWADSRGLISPVSPDGLLHLFFLLIFFITFITFVLGLQKIPNLFLKICKIQNSILEHQGTYLLSLVKTKK
jgi:hypothetical protein